MTEFKEPVFYVPGTTTIIDNAVDRAGVLVAHYSGETLEQIRLRHPGAALGEWDDIYAEIEASCKTEPLEINEDEFLKALNVLPPVRWTQRSDSESFKISERLYGSITAIYARLGDRYYTFSDHIALPHDEVVSRITQMLRVREKRGKRKTNEGVRSQNNVRHANDNDP
jgi:hypothetical protein